MFQKKSEKPNERKFLTLTLDESDNTVTLFDDFIRNHKTNNLSKILDPFYRNNFSTFNRIF